MATLGIAHGYIILLHSLIYFSVSCFLQWWVLVPYNKALSIIQFYSLMHLN